MINIGIKPTIAVVICLAIISGGQPVFSDNLGNSKVFSAVSQAAEKGDPIAQFMLGSSYYNGSNGLGRDYKKAFYWFMKAAQQNHADAQVSVSNCYLFGHGVEADEERAFHWTEKASLLGNIDAQINLGGCYSGGIGVDKDEGEAFKWFLKAAKGGSPTSQFKVGQYYEYGKVVEKSMAEAIKWYRKSAEGGYSPAINKLKDIEENSKAK